MAVKICQFPGIGNVYFAFSNRKCGNISQNGEQPPETVWDNRMGIMREMACRGADSWHELKQVHGTDIVVEPDGTDTAGIAPDQARADGAMTSKPGLALAIKTADCQPILFTDSKGAHIMAIHCGWRGNRAGFPQIAVKKFCQQYDLAPADIFAVRGPSLGPNHAEFTNFDLEWGPDFEKWFDYDKKTMNLWQLTHDQLTEAGVPDKQIFGINICTFENNDSWFSYRAKHERGRQVGLIWMYSNDLPF